MPERFQCILCQKVLRNAFQTSCGCKACKICFEKYLEKGHKPCPSNQFDCASVILKWNENIYSDNATNREIFNLNVKCPFKDCLFSDLLKNMVSHIDSCDYREMKCDQCSLVFIKKDKLSHDQNNCEMRNVICPHCNKCMKHKDLWSIHLDVNNDNLCDKLIEYCPNKCPVKFKVKLKDHLHKCANKLENCPFNYFGCEIEKMNKNDLKKHLENELLSHMLYLITKFKVMESKIEDSKEKLETQKQINKELFSINQSAVEHKIKFEKSLEELKNKQPINNSNTCENGIFRNGSFIWKIFNFFLKKREAENGRTLSIISPPFYTSDFGYKLCMKIYPDGDGVGKGAYLSVFFVIMKGEYDDMLPWPFKQKVTLGILDQEGTNKHISDTFKPDIRSTCYQKPTDEYNIASGSPKFVMIDKLYGDSLYCKNDTIYLKISVDNSGLLRS